MKELIEFTSEELKKIIMVPTDRAVEYLNDLLRDKITEATDRVRVGMRRAYCAHSSVVYEAGTGYCLCKECGKRWG